MDYSKPKSPDINLGTLFNEGGAKAHKKSVADELKERFDVLVDMNAQHTAAKGISMATFGLCGCIGGYIDNPDTNTFFHYDPLSVSMIDALANQHVSSETARVHFFVPGEWQIDAGGKYDLQPQNDYVERILRSTILLAQSRGVECIFHCYEELQCHGDDYMARSQGTAWIDKEGKLFAGGLAVQSVPKSAPRGLTP